MTKTILCLLLLMSFACCEHSTKSSSTRVLTYAVNTEILNDSISQYTKDYLNQKHGDSVHIFYDSRGNIRMNYFGIGKSGLSYNIYNAEKHILCAKWKNLDTTYYYNTLINEYTLDSTENVEQPNGFILKYFFHSSHTKDNYTQEFHFINDSLQVNPSLYKDFKDFFFADIIEESNSLPVKTIITSKDIKLTRRLVRTRTITDPKVSFFHLINKFH